MTANRKFANTKAVGLLKHVRHMIEPKPADQMLDQARQAQVLLSQIIDALQLEKPGDKVEFEPVSGDMVEMMGQLRQTLQELLDPLGFCLLTFSMGPNAELSYVTNAHEGDVCELMRLFIAAYEKQGGGS